MKAAHVLAARIYAEIPDYRSTFRKHAQDRDISVTRPMEQLGTDLVALVIAKTAVGKDGTQFSDEEIRDALELFDKLWATHQSWAKRQGYIRRALQKGK